MKRLSIFIKWFILPILVFILLRKAWTSLISRYLVAPLFSFVAPESLTYDIAILLLVCLAGTALYKNIVLRGAQVPPGWASVLLATIAIYIYYRSFDATFVFTGFSFASDIKLLDVIMLFPLLVLAVSAFVPSKKENIIGPNDVSKGFDVDEARIIDIDYDILNRTKFIETIIEKLEHTTTAEGSFPIGIMARWGAGKTTLIRSLIQRLDREKWIVVNFNVWNCSTPAQVVDSFFKLLRQELDKYSFTLDRKLREYTADLLKGVDNETLGIIKNITELFSSSTSLERQYSDINEEIKRIGKKIAIVIDDLDRLDKREIYEVIRIIRNTGSFSNTFFIVAYDRNYILNAIEEINPYQAHYFLEKIFQVEFTLPPIPAQTIELELSKRILPILTQDDQEDFKKFKKESFTLPDYGPSDLTSKFIHSFRDLVRFVNSFSLNYEWVKEEVYLPDFYNLELIRFKHPELFIDIYRHFSDFFTEEDKERHRKSTKFSIKQYEKNGLYLRDYLKRTSSHHKLTDTDIERLISALWAVFPPPEFHLESKYYGKRSHLAVGIPSKVDRYFLGAINGAILEIQFSKMRALPLESFQQELRELGKNQDLTQDIHEKFWNIKGFDNREDFEKVVSALLYFANLPDPSEDTVAYNNFIGIDGTRLARLLGSPGAKNLYATLEDYKHFLSSVLQLDATTYSYNDSFLASLLSSNKIYIGEVFENAEIESLLLANLSYAISKADTLDLHLWYKFDSCKHHWKAKQLMRGFIFEKDLDGYLASAVQRLSFQETYGLGNVVDNVFDSPEAFVRMLKVSRVQSRYRDEFLAFYNALTTDPQYQKSGVPLDFFKVIPVAVNYDLRIAAWPTY